MGQSESKEEEPKQHPHSAAATSLSKHASVRESSRDKARRAAAPPSAALAATTASTSTSTAHAHATVSHTRARSITTSGAKPSPLHEPSSASSHKSETAAMGQTQSLEHRHLPPSRAATLPPAPIAADEAKPEPAAPAQPVDVPMQTGVPDDDFVPTGIHTPAYGLPPSDFTRPPRLPLPIEEEVHTPGSPIITPHDFGPAIDHGDVDGTIPRQASVLSSTTVDDDDVGDDQYLPEFNPSAPGVPTKLEWKGHGDKIYVTGTFVNWDRKFKLHKNKDGPGYSTTLSLRPGTHHIKFLVQNDMFTSDDLPTTVDYTNVLVNYIEVVAPKSLTPQPPAPAEPMPIPGAAQTEAENRADPSFRPEDLQDASKTAETDADLASTLAHPDSRKPSVAEPDLAAAQQQKPVKQKLPRPKYTNQLPDYLHHLDVYTNPDDERCRRANRVISQLPQPPSLPMFMSKSILNGQTPHKDDASVLIMPNHTVLNHLATSSIKSGVLATSGTTRYKRKFLTTIMYKPTSDAG